MLIMPIAFAEGKFRVHSGAASNRGRIPAAEPDVIYDTANYCGRCHRMKLMK